MRGQFLCRTVCSTHILHTHPSWGPALPQAAVHAGPPGGLPSPSPKLLCGNRQPPLCRPEMGSGNQTSGLSHITVCCNSGSATVPLSRAESVNTTIISPSGSCQTFELWCSFILDAWLVQQVNFPSDWNHLHRMKSQIGCQVLSKT